MEQSSHAEVSKWFKVFTIIILNYSLLYFYPASGIGTGYRFRAISFFVSLFVSLSATLRENGWTDLHEIFREGARCGVTMGRPE